MEDESAIPVLEDEAIQFECLLVEPQDDHVSVDAFLCFHSNCPEKCMEMEDIPCKFDGLKFGTDQEQQHLLGREVFDIKTSKIEAEKIQEPTISSSNCEDYLLDVEFGESGIKLDNDLSVGLQKVVSESDNQADRVGDNGTPEKSDSSGTTDQVSNCQADLDMNDSESHDIFSCTADSEMSLEERWFKYPTFTLHNTEEDVSSMFSERNNKSTVLTPGLPSGPMLCPSTFRQENEHISLGAEEKEESVLVKDVSLPKNSIQAICISTPAEKRLRKPPQRFIDELSEPKSRSFCKRKEVATPTGKLPQFSHKQCDVKSRGERLSPEESAGIAIQVPFGPIVQKEHRTSHISVVAKVSQPDKEASMSESEDDDVTEVKLGEDSSRRKHHILWTVSEVRKLIDGVSQYGVGRWSRIKKDFFSSSAHRTPVDLKDKWRNLLKACCAQRESKRGDDRKRNLAWRPLPKSVLRRVSELSTIYPYPRDLRSKR